MLTATALTARGFRPDGTREVFSDQPRVDGGVSWNRRGRDMKGGEKALRRNADGWSIQPIVCWRWRFDHVIVLEDLCSRRIAKRGLGRIREHGIVLRIDVVAFRVEDIAKGEVKERRVVGRRTSQERARERVFSVVNVLGEARRVCGFGCISISRERTIYRRRKLGIRWHIEVVDSS